jgi:hypothetical protein
MEKILNMNHNGTLTYHLVDIYVCAKPPCHEDVWRSVSIAPCILIHCTKWRRVVRFVLEPLYSPGKAQDGSSLDVMAKGQLPALSGTKLIHPVILSCLVPQYIQSLPPSMSHLIFATC